MTVLKHSFASASAVPNSDSAVTVNNFAAFVLTFALTRRGTEARFMFGKEAVSAYLACSFFVTTFHMDIIGRIRAFVNGAENNGRKQVCEWKSIQ